MSEARKNTRAVEMFFSYSHKDEELRDELSKHLAILKRQGVITAWHDRKIGGGNEWSHEIDEHLNSADIILLLVSSDFLASDYCYDIEVKRAMERHNEGDARVIPVVLRPVDWKGAPFDKLQSLPKDAKPVTAWPSRDEAFLNVVHGIRAAAEELLIRKLDHLLASFTKVSSLKNWPNAISLGERILNELPDHAPAYQTIRSRTAAAYVKRWSRYLEQSDSSWRGYSVEIRTKRHENAKEIRQAILADLDRAIKLDPDNAEYCYLRFCLGADNSFLDRAIELDPSVVQYYSERASLRRDRGDKDGAFQDYSRVAELEGRQPPTRMTDEEAVSKLRSFLEKPDAFREIFKKPGDLGREKKDPWRLKCLKD
jgi:tetratricopeptide (TPR) repeat protein